MPPPLPPSQPSQPHQHPTCTNVRIRSVDDAHKIFFAVHKDILAMVTRRLDADERAALRTGCVYAWEERSPNTEITGLGIERFTEGRRWSASRVRDEFLFYYEKYVPLDASQGNEQPPGWEQLVKQTYSVWITTEKGKRKWHLTAYFTQSTVDHLGTVDDLEAVRNLEVPSGMFTSTRVGKRKNTDADASTSNVSRIYAAFPALAPRPTPTPAGPRIPSPSIQMYDPYSRPPSRPQQPPSPVAAYTPDPQPSAPRPDPRPSSQPPELHFSYPSPQNFSEPPPPYQSPIYPRQSPVRPQSYGNNNSATSSYATTRATHRPLHREHSPEPQPQPASGGWYTAPLASFHHQRSDSPRSDYHSGSSSSSSSYASSPGTQLYPLLPGSDSESGGNGGGGTDPRSLPRLLIPNEPPPVNLLHDADDRREDSMRRDLAPLHSLRLHPYRRDPTDDKALRLLGPGRRARVNDRPLALES
ncbi:camp-independent regulatory protein pac2 [Favolaschia claudopus]|uniref:Camp-independent regulatory protein pac2 n=1 Tax=Favolaschia claudopus TaxID=2862362 RepID=A0AAW0A9V7_9AGAR